MAHIYIYIYLYLHVSVYKCMQYNIILYLYILFISLWSCALSLTVCQGASQYQTSALCTTSCEASHADGMAWTSRAKLVLVGGDAASCRAAATHETWVCDVGIWGPRCPPLNITGFEKYRFATLLTWRSRFLLAPSRYKKFPSKVSFVLLNGI